MRLFLAINLSDDVKRELIRIQKIIGSEHGKIKLLKENQLHITLKFLGEVDETHTRTIIERLHNIEVTSFTAVLDKLGVFPNNSYIRILWAGLENIKEISALQSQIDSILIPLSFKPEDNYHPHITLARVKFLKDKKDFLQKITALPLQKIKFRVSEFVLYKSQLTPKGPEYKIIERFAKLM